MTQEVFRKTIYVSSLVCVCSVMSDFFWPHVEARYLSGLPSSTLGDLPGPGIEPESLANSITQEIILKNYLGIKS